MERLDLATAPAKVLEDIRRYLTELRRIVPPSVQSVGEGIAVLSAIRQASYEDLNQIQHEYAALCAARWLVNNGHSDGDPEWQWNPRQTGDSSEPDVRAVRDGQVLVSAEVTTSLSPKGVIDTRMGKTLAKLAGMQGKKFYFVLSRQMEVRARTKVQKGALPVTVVLLEAADAETVGRELLG
ncbi:MAG: hypothetical protein K1X67_12275 [Fimbriimonadaceae bacterium]|nr:hypothetical protein [Fimbriimonadaceae bacterium]